MTIKKYADVLKFAIQMQIGYVEEEMEKSLFVDDNRLDGIITGLRIAMDKIDASMFLAEK